MIDVIIFSRNRAAQLDLLLRSLKRNSNHVFAKVYVLYTWSDDSFMAGYALAQDNHRDVEFRSDTWLGSFRTTLSHLIKECEHDFLMFLTDDDVLYKPIPVSRKQIGQAFDDQELCCLSLRLGQNTKVQDPYRNVETVFPKEVDLSSLPFVKWAWATVPSHMNFGYPLSVDGHVFRRELMDDFASSLQYDNPNTFEGNMQHLNVFCKPSMACFTHSVVVNSPTNRVQEACPNRAGEVFGESAKTMNNSFVRGWYIDMDETDFSGIIGCHQEIDFKWTDKS